MGTEIEIEVTNGELFNAIDSLNKLIDMKLPVKTSLEVVKLAGKFTEPIKEALAVRKGLAKKHGITFKKDTVGGTVPESSDPQGVPKYMAEALELANLSVTLKFEKVKLPSVVDGKSLQIEPSILIALEKFIDIVE